MIDLSRAETTMDTNEPLSLQNNPYAAALDGLVLADPVAAFFDFCKAREKVRVARESGQQAPWSTDPIFQRGRFLNVFREDDRGSKAILKFAAPTADDLPTLVHALFFARWCNRSQTLSNLPLSYFLQGGEELQLKLQKLPEQPWCNVTAYPVEPVTYEGVQYSRVDAACSLFGRIAPVLAEAILGAGGEVVAATAAVNSLLGMKNDFPIFMAVMDIAWFRPDVIKPESAVPTGIGAVAFLDRLQKHLGLADHEQTCAAMIQLQAEHWPEAKRRSAPSVAAVS